MSRYTTGELAKLCGVTVRTVQYYDTRGILVPSELSEGGRRLYSEDDVRRLKIICFLRELGLPIDAISRLLSEEDPGSVISMLLDEQEKALKKDLSDVQEKLNRLADLKAGLKQLSTVSVESIGDIAYTMNSRKELRKIHFRVLWMLLPLAILQWAAIYLWIRKGIRWLFGLQLVLAAIVSYPVIMWYFRRVSYICPQCHTVFKPTRKEAFFARHTPYTRRLKCPCCNRLGFCVEVVGEQDGEPV
ncbi:MAG: MerR family transcriptional regulator [Solobacterium sp.]|nr:MerR family transcriptional regulator [Solobacterium sp.]